MKRIVLIWCLICVYVFMTPVAHAIETPTLSNVSCLELSKNLMLGMQDASVILLQQFLRSQGYFTNTEYSMSFGPLTRDAVISFQMAHGLITSPVQLGAGFVGPLTIEKIKEISCPVAQEPVAGQGVAKIDATSIYANQKRGENKYRYTVSIKPADDIEAWDIKLICDGDQISTKDRTIKECGDSRVFSVGSTGKKTFSLRYQNSSRANQTVGIIASALDKNGFIIDTVERIDYVAAPGIRDLEPHPSDDLKYRVLPVDPLTGVPFVVGGSGTTSGTSANTTGSQDRRAPTASAEHELQVRACELERQKILERWSQRATKSHWRGGTLIDAFSLPVKYRTQSATTNNAHKIKIVQPNNRTISEIFDAYHDSYTFPGLEYVGFLHNQGLLYARTEKPWQREVINETSVSAEKKRQEITTIIPAVPPVIVSEQQLDTGDKLVFLGELFATNQFTDGDISAPTAQWMWQYREFGLNNDKKRIINGTIATDGVAVTARQAADVSASVFCGGRLQNSDYDIVLFRK